MKSSMCGALVLFFFVGSASISAQPPSAEELVKQQREELLPLKWMDGVWRGKAWTIGRSGKIEINQTERVGSMIEGSVKVVEGRGYDNDGNVTFNAFGTIAYDSTKKQLGMRSFAQGRVGDFEIKLTDNGYTWEIPAGPMKIRYTAEFTDGTWVEYGEQIRPDADPFRFFEMTLKRVGDTEWPAKDPIPFKPPQ